MILYLMRYAISYSLINIDQYFWRIFHLGAFSILLYVFIQRHFWILKLEQERDHVASAIQCYVKEHGASSQEACKKSLEMIENAWKELNQECLNQKTISMHLLMRVVNLARVMETMYREYDTYTHSSTTLKDYITLLLVQPIMLWGLAMMHNPISLATSIFSMLLEREHMFSFLSVISVSYLIVYLLVACRNKIQFDFIFWCIMNLIYIVFDMPTGSNNSMLCIHKGENRSGMGLAYPYQFYYYEYDSIREKLVSISSKIKYYFLNIKP